MVLRRRVTEQSPCSHFRRPSVLPSFLPSHPGLLICVPYCEGHFATNFVAPKQRQSGSPLGMPLQTFLLRLSTNSKTLPLTNPPFLTDGHRWKLPCESIAHHLVLGLESHPQRYRSGNDALLAARAHVIP